MANKDKDGNDVVKLNAPGAKRNVEDDFRSAGGFAFSNNGGGCGKANAPLATPKPKRHHAGVEEVEEQLRMLALAARAEVASPLGAIGRPTVGPNISWRRSASASGRSKP